MYGLSTTGRQFSTAASTTALPPWSHIISGGALIAQKLILLIDGIDQRWAQVSAYVSNNFNNQIKKSEKPMGRQHTTEGLRRLGLKLNWVPKALNIGGVAVGLIGGILGVIGFFKADATMEAFRHRGRLRVSMETGKLTLVNPLPGTIFTPGEPITVSAVYEKATLKITNDGDLPSRDVVIAVRFSDPTINADPVFLPEFPFEKSAQASTYYYSLKSPIGPTDELTVMFSPAPVSIVVHDENGLSSVVNLVPSAIQFVRDATTKGESKGREGSDGASAKRR